MSSFSSNRYDDYTSMQVSSLPFLCKKQVSPSLMASLQNHFYAVRLNFSCIVRNFAVRLNLSCVVRNCAVRLSQDKKDLQVPSGNPQAYLSQYTLLICSSDELFTDRLAILSLPHRHHTFVKFAISFLKSASLIPAVFAAVCNVIVPDSTSAARAVTAPS